MCCVYCFSALRAFATNLVWFHLSSSAICMFHIIPYPFSKMLRFQLRWPCVPIMSILYRTIYGNLCALCHWYQIEPHSIYTINIDTMNWYLLRRATELEREREVENFIEENASAEMLESDPTKESCLSWSKDRIEQNHLQINAETDLIKCLKLAQELCRSLFWICFVVVYGKTKELVRNCLRHPTMQKTFLFGESQL